MLAGNLKYDKADSEKNSRAERILKGRADYNDYLELLLHSVSENIKNYRTMTAMELRIIDMGKTPSFQERETVDKRPILA